jgi:putative Holliday junction resolvase
VSVYLGFDFGRKRIGVAIGDSVTRAARPLRAVANDPGAVQRLLQEWNPAACIVGLPLSDDSGEQAITAEARAFADGLRRTFKGDVHLCDERYSSRAAAGDLRDARASGTMARRVRKGDEDSAAAKLILEQWMREAGLRAEGKE